MRIALLADIVIILGMSIGVLLVCSRLRIPSIVRFLLAGVLAGERRSATRVVHIKDGLNREGRNDP